MRLPRRHHARSEDWSHDLWAAVVVDASDAEEVGRGTAPDVTFHKSWLTRGLFTDPFQT